jgi:hypothetical protein
MHLTEAVSLLVLVLSAAVAVSEVMANRLATMIAMAPPLSLLVFINGFLESVGRHRCGMDGCIAGSRDDVERIPAVALLADRCIADCPHASRFCA